MSEPSVESSPDEVLESKDSEEMSDAEEQSESTPEDISPDKDGKLLKQVIREGKGRSPSTVMLVSPSVHPNTRLG